MNEYQHGVTKGQWIRVFNTPEGRQLWRLLLEEKGKTGGGNLGPLIDDILNVAREVAFELYDAKQPTLKGR